ncbi:MAG TPA: hypothetical protein VMT52_18190, partial [Planctomycetota bacterium]|nr:hypothetical protein [Planctomycetota bacterium]
MPTDTGEKSRPPLLILGDVPPRWDLIDRPALRQIEAWLLDPEAPATLWLEGPAGSGRTTAVAGVLRRAGAGG